MAESPTSTSEKPPMEKVGLGFLIDDEPPSDPTNPEPEIVEIHRPLETPENTPAGETDPPAAVMGEVVCEIAVVDEETEWRNAIEKDLRELTIHQAHIEGAGERLESFYEEKGHDSGAEEKSEQDDANDGRGSESVKEDENEISGGDGDKEGNAAGKLDDEEMKLGRYNQNNNRRKINYPMRPDAEDCAFYMKFGSCKFGLNCKFNHPPKRKNLVCLNSLIDYATNVSPKVHGIAVIGTLCLFNHHNMFSFCRVLRIGQITRKRTQRRLDKLSARLYSFFSFFFVLLFYFIFNFMF